MTQPEGNRPGARLHLERPLAVIDTESTGLNPETARIVRLSVLIVQPDGTESLRSELINPGLPIPPGATAVHGASDEDVARRPQFRAYARALADALEGCDLAGFAIERFHLPLLLAEFRRAGVEFSMDGRAVVDVMAIYHRLEPRDFDAAYRTYVGDGPAPDRSAGQRSHAAFRILLGQIGSDRSLPSEPQALARWAKGVPEQAVDEDGRFTRRDDGEIIFNFGKYTGEPLADIVEKDASYVEWVASNPGFSGGSRKLAADALLDAADAP